MLLDIDYYPRQGHVAYENAYLTFLPSPPLSHWVHSFWQLNVPAGKFYYRSVPDNSVDWIINLNCPEDNFIVTPFCSSIVFELTGPVSYFGVRFRILGHQGLILTPLGEWGAVDDETKTAEVLPSHLLHAVYESIGKSLQFNERCKYLSTTLLSTVKYPDIDSRLASYIRYCYKNITSNISLSDKQCSEFGVSARQLRRLTQLHLGLTPRDFARVLRFQHTLQVMSAASYKAAWADHYYDQPHYIREFKRLSGLTPTEFKSLSVLYNSELSV
jgi:AraC-like DNA-binding protein